MIPKNIIQIWTGPEGSDFDYLMHLRKSWQIAYPEWNHLLFLDKQIDKLVKQYSDEAWGLYQAIPIATYKADFARLIILYLNGGVYLDLDTTPNLDLEQYAITSDEMSWGLTLSMDYDSVGHPNHSNFRGVVTNNHQVAAEKGCYLIKDMIESIILDSKQARESAHDSSNKDFKNGFWASTILSTTAWGTMLLNELDKLSDGDYMAKHLASGYGKLGPFWITYDGKEVRTRKYREMVTHIGSLALKDFVDTNPTEDPFKLLGELYKDINIRNAQIKIEMGGSGAV